MVTLISGALTDTVLFSGYGSGYGDGDGSGYGDGYGCKPVGGSP